MRRTSHGYVDNVYADVSVAGVSVPVGTLLGVLLRILEVLLFYDLFALDHAASAVLAAVLAFLAGHAAAGAVVIVLDLGADDLFLSALVGTKSQTSRDPVEEFHEEEYGREYEPDGE